MAHLEKRIKRNQRQPRRNNNPLPADFVYSPYDPLEPGNLSADIVRRLVENAARSLNDLDNDSERSIVGKGVYAIYYTGPHPIYEQISGTQIPIYVGLSSSDTRKGGRPSGRPIEEFLDKLAQAEKPEPSFNLLGRLRNHKQSIIEASQQDDRLNIDYFEIRYLVTESIFALRAESMLKEHYRPVWNDCIDGFGNKDPGGGRRGNSLQEKKGVRPKWDTLHRGRWWADLMHERKETQAELEQKVTDYLGTLIQ